MYDIKKIVEILVKEKASKITIAQVFIWYKYTTSKEGISLSEINIFFEDNHLPKYNLTYLKNDLKKSRAVSRDTKTLKYKPLHNLLSEMHSKFALLEPKSEDVISDEDIIPKILADNTRGYIINLINQINASYHYNIFDGCAILMRRLLEILLIHSYQGCSKESEIKDGHGYKKLNIIINQVISDKPFTLSKNTLDVLHTFRELGNFSAHSIQYNARRVDINNIKMKYRVAIEELLYTSNLRT